jgi:hypothetical protein
LRCASSNGASSRFWNCTRLRVQSHTDAAQRPPEPLLRVRHEAECQFLPHQAFPKVFLPSPRRHGSTAPVRGRRATLRAQGRAAGQFNVPLSSALPDRPATVPMPEPSTLAFFALRGSLMGAARLRRRCLFCAGSASDKKSVYATQEARLLSRAGSDSRAEALKRGSAISGCPATCPVTRARKVSS